MGFFFFFQAEDGIRDDLVTGVQTCALPILSIALRREMVRPFRISYRAKSGELVPLEVAIVRLTLRASKRLLLAHMVIPIEEVRVMPPEAPRPASEPHTDARVRGLTTREIDVLGRLARGQ